MSDLVKRLRASSDPGWNPYHNVYKALVSEAADALEAAEAKLALAMTIVEGYAAGGWLDAQDTLMRIKKWKEL